MSSTDSDPGFRRDVRTRIVHLDGGQARDPDANLRTLVVAPWDEPAAVPFEALFVAHYRAIRGLGRSVHELGVAVVAIHVPTCRLVARAWVAARPDRVQSSIVGRHSQADVLLDDPRISLRHLAILVPPPTRWEPHALGFEILDLRTPHAFHDERGRPLEALRAEGPALVSVPPFALYALPTGDPSDWPELATDAWAMLPERVFLDERRAEPDRFRRGAHRARPRAEGSIRESHITLLPALAAPADRLVDDDEQPAGHLHVLTPRGSRRLAVGPRALSRGILLGRYERCDVSELFEDTVSRAHLLVKEVGGHVVGIDTASTCGTYVQGREDAVRTVALGAGQTAILADAGGTVRWEPASD